MKEEKRKGCWMFNPVRFSDFEHHPSLRPAADQSAACALKDTSSLHVCDLPPLAPTSWLLFPSPPLVDEKIGVPGGAL